MAVKVATRKCGVVHDIKEMQQVVSLITRETVLLLECLRVGFGIRHT